MDQSDQSYTLPGLKLFVPSNKLLNIEKDETALSVCGPPICDRPPSTQLPVQTETHSLRYDSSGMGLEATDPSTPGNITIPRPHGRKTPELGSILTFPMAQSRSRTGAADGGTTLGGQEFRQALSMTTDEELLMSTKTTEDSIDLISLLDPLNSSEPTSSTSFNNGIDIGVLSSTCKPTLPLRSYPQRLSPFPLHPKMTLNPFSQPLQHTPPQIHYSPTVSGNPFSTVDRPRPSSYLHTPPQPQSFSTVPDLYRQHLPGSTAHPSCDGQFQSAFPSQAHSSASNHTLSSLADTMSASSAATHILTKSFCAEGDSEVTQDPFGDLLIMAKPATPQIKKVEDLRSRWETFE